MLFVSWRRVLRRSGGRGSSGSSSGVGDLAASQMLLEVKVEKERMNRSFLLGAKSGVFSFGALTICPSGSFDVGALINGFSRGGTSCKL